MSKFVWSLRSTASSAMVETLYNTSLKVTIQGIFALTDIANVMCTLSYVLLTVTLV